MEKPLLALVAVFSLTSINADVLTSTAADLRPELLRRCPFSRFCTREPLKPLPNGNVESCCAPCSCHRDCRMIGSCCPDFNVTSHTSDTNETFGPDFECRTQNDVYNVPRGLDNSAVQTRYRIIDSCLTRNETCSELEHIDDFVMVSDNNNEFVFKNRRCAYCNGYTELTEWNLVVVCLGMILERFDTMDDRNAYVVENCPVTSLPPSPGIGRMSRCIDYLQTSKCAASWHLREYDSQIEQGCIVTDLPFSVYMYSGNIGRVKYYSNVFCFLCNSRPGIEPVNLCPRNNDDAAEKELMGRVSFTAVLDMHSDVAVSNVDKEGHGDEIFDPYMNEYEKLICPRSFAANGGTCEPVTKSSSGVGVLINYEVVFSSSLNRLAFSDTNTFINIIVSVLKEDLGIDTYDCGICTVSAFIERQPTNASQLVVLTIHTTESCNYLVVANLIRERSEVYTKNTYNIAENGISGRMLPVMTRHTVQHGSRESIRRSYKRCITEMMTTLPQLMLVLDCPRIHKSVSDLEMLGLNISGMSDLEVIYNGQIRRPVNDTDSVFVCVDFYFSIGRANYEKPQIGRGPDFGTTFFIIIIPRAAAIVICAYMLSYNSLKFRILSFPVYFYNILGVIFVLSETFFICVRYIESDTIYRTFVSVLNYLWLLLSSFSSTFAALTFLQFKSSVSPKMIMLLLLSAFCFPASLSVCVEVLLRENSHSASWKQNQMPQLYLYAPRLVASVLLANTIVLTAIVNRTFTLASKKLADFLDEEFQVIVFCMRFCLLIVISWLLGFVYDITSNGIFVGIQSCAVFANSVNMMYSVIRQNKCKKRMNLTMETKSRQQNTKS